jgi:predicted SprT family Zn-dependent metalloprotease
MSVAVEPTSRSEALERAHRSLRGAYEAWGSPGDAQGIRLEFSGRMTTSLGRCYPTRRLIRLNDALTPQSAADLLHEVVCHEAAHIVAYERHGRSIRPHGHEWASLLVELDVPARARIPCDVELDAVLNKRRRRSLRFEHRCTVCQAVRYARRAYPRWRCATCVSAGLSGTLRIVSHPKGAPEASVGGTR